MIQDLIVGIVIIACAAWLVRKAVAKRRGACGCDHCPSQRAPRG